MVKSTTATPILMFIYYEYKLISGASWMKAKYPQLEDRDWLYQKYWVEELSTVKIGKELGCSYGTVMDWMEKLGIQRRSLSEAGDIMTPVRYPQLRDRDWLFRKYWVEELSTSDIAEELGCCPEVVGRAMRRLNIPCRPRSEAVSKGHEKNAKYPLLHDAEWLKKQYVDNELSSCDISETLDCTPSGVRYALDKVGIPRRKASFYCRGESKYPELLNKKWLLEKYVAGGLSQTEIAAIIGCSQTSVGAAFNSLGIPIRENPNIMYPKAYDREFLRQRYVVEQKRTTEISEEIGCDRTTILNNLKLLGIPTKSMKEQANEGRGRQERSENALKQWRNSEVVKKMFAGFRANPNNFEKRIDNVLQKYIPREWAYNGGFDCEIMIGGLIPDFVNINGRKQLIEGFGEPFHGGFFNSSWKRTEFGRKAIFSQFGYDVLVLWYLPVKKMTDEEIAEVVKDFMKGKTKWTKKRGKKKSR